MAPESEATERKRLARLSRPQWEERSGSNEHRALIRRPGLLLHRGGDRRSLSRPIGTRRSRSLSFPSLILIPPFHSCRRRRRIGHGRRSLPLTLLLLFLRCLRRRAHPRPFSRLPEGAMCSCTYIALSLCPPSPSCRSCNSALVGTTHARASFGIASSSQLTISLLLRRLCIVVGRWDGQSVARSGDANWRRRRRRCRPAPVSGGERPWLWLRVHLSRGQRCAIRSR